MAARAGFEPTTLRLKVIDSSNAPPRPTSFSTHASCPRAFSLQADTPTEHVQRPSAILIIVHDHTLQMYVKGPPLFDQQQLLERMLFLVHGLSLAEVHSLLLVPPARTFCLRNSLRETVIRHYILEANLNQSAYHG